MNLKELNSELIRLGVNEQTYSLCDDVGDEQYCLQTKNGKWHYFYSERGHKTSEQEFSSERDACEFFLTILKSDPTIKF